MKEEEDRISLLPDCLLVDIISRLPYSITCAIRIDEDLIQSILSGSPLMETLELNSCYGAFSRIDITSKSVKNMVFFAYSGYGVLSRLEAKGFVFPPGLRLPDDSDSEKTD
ncbi:hypothetical protein Tco_0156676 [Tanacetum coccineum]